MATASVVVKTEIETAFNQLKTLLIKNKCEVTSENSPFSLSALQGSLWGVTPKAAKKTLKFQFYQTNVGTRVSSTSKLSLSYVKCGGLCFCSLVKRSLRLDFYGFEHI